MHGHGHKTISRRALLHACDRVPLKKSLEVDFRCVRPLADSCFRAHSHPGTSRSFPPHPRGPVFPASGAQAGALIRSIKLQRRRMHWPHHLPTCPSLSFHEHFSFSFSSFHNPFAMLSSSSFFTLPIAALLLSSSASASPAPRTVATTIPISRRSVSTGIGRGAASDDIQRSKARHGDISFSPSRVGVTSSRRAVSSNPFDIRELGSRGLSGAASITDYSDTSKGWRLYHRFSLTRPTSFSGYKGSVFGMCTKKLVSCLRILIEV